MPLPTRQMQWPPADLAAVLPAMSRWSAWYSGDTDALHRAYAPSTRFRNHSSQYRGGIVGAIGRTFWGEPRHDLTQPKIKLHVPLAADICQASADLLFSEPPAITTDDDATNGRLGELVDDGMLSTLAEAAELGAALSGTYLRVTWDQPSQPAGPFFTACDADGAWPEFRFGRLQALTLWWDVTPADQRGNDRVLRHLERHELQDGRGVILHGMYEGTRDQLGRAVPLNGDVVGDGVMRNLTSDGQTIDTLSPGLAVVYVPNQRPQRAWRHDPLGRNLGRSDLDGIEGLMDSLDETYTSWMRDVRLGKSRIMLPDAMLEALGPGRGAAWDSDREVYTGLTSLAGTGRDSSTLPIVAQQFAIRWAEHQATAQQFIGDILRTAGYSTQTFGMDSGIASDTTATEIVARQQRSYMTRDRKVRLWRPAIAAAVEKLLAIDAAIFGGPGTAQRPDVQFADGVQESTLVLAQTAQALRAAEAASTETLVTMVHPDWDDEQISTEVAAILKETAAAVPAVADPFASVPADPAAGAAATVDAQQQP